MAYVKDPTTGKYIKTDTPIKAIAPVNVPSTPISAPAVKYGKDASGKYTTVSTDGSDAMPTKPKVTTVSGLQDYAAQQGVDVSNTQPKESVLQRLLHVLNTGAYAVGAQRMRQD